MKLTKVRKQHFLKGGTRLRLLLLIALIAMSSTTKCILAQEWNEVDILLASDRSARDNLGSSVAISGDYAIVGASNSQTGDTAGSTILVDAGAAYIYKYDSGAWSEVQKIVASDRAIFDYFGSTVAISGNYAMVYAMSNYEDTINSTTIWDAGAVYVFKNNGGIWSQVQKIVASDIVTGGSFGSSIGMSGDYAVISDPSQDKDSAGSNYIQNAGAAYIFKNNGGVWSEVQKIVPSDRFHNSRFGISSDISENHVVVGAYWNSTDTSGLDTLNRAGAAYIFRNNGGTWSQVKKIVSSDREANDWFGYKSAISGDYIVVGAPLNGKDTAGENNLINAGSSYIFHNDGGRWSEVQKIVASDRDAQDRFSRLSIDISGDYLVLGSDFHRTDEAGLNQLTLAGAAYIFHNNGVRWSEVQKIVASDRLDGVGFGSGDRFGNAAISEDYTIVGATNRDSDVGTLNLSRAGAAYVFKNCIARSIDTHTVCDSFTWIDGITYTESNDSATFNIIGGAANGCDSLVTLHLTINNSAVGVDTQTSCNSFTWIDGLTYTESNDSATFNIIGGAANGCDSLVTLHLTVNSISDITTSISGTDISANNTIATYQWLDCDNDYTIINGETGRIFKAMVNGNYAVELTENDCVDTSACVAITSLGVVENSFKNHIKVYPNPTNGNFSIDLGKVYENTNIVIANIDGKLVKSKTVVQSQVLNLTIEEPSGVYIIRIQSSSESAVIRLIKN